MTRRPEVGLVKSRWTVLNQHAEPVMTMEGWGMMRKRSPLPARDSENH
jgi:acyl dehydratase